MRAHLRLNAEPFLALQLGECAGDDRSCGNVEQVWRHGIAKQKPNIRRRPGPTITDGCVSNSTSRSSKRRRKFRVRQLGCCSDKSPMGFAFLRAARGSLYKTSS